MRANPRGEVPEMAMRRAARLLGALIAALFLLPPCMIVISSFMDGEELSVIYSDRHAFRLIPCEATLSGYWELLFASQAYLAAFWNSLWIAASATALNAGISLVAGYALARARFRGRGGVLFLYGFVMLLPFQVTLLPNYLLARALHLYNTWWALVLPCAFAPMGAVLLRQFIRELPGEMLEAAYMDTDSHLRVLAQIVAPNVRAGLLAAAVLTFAESWNMVEQPLILLEDAWLQPLSLRLDALASSALDVRFSGAVLYMIPAILLYFLFENELIDGVKHLKL